MVSTTPFARQPEAFLQRRDLIAICTYLNRRHEEVRPNRDPFEHAEGILQQLAAAARMQ